MAGACISRQRCATVTDRNAAINDVGVVDVAVRDDASAAARHGRFIHTRSVIPFHSFVSAVARWISVVLRVCCFFCYFTDSTPPPAPLFSRLLLLFMRHGAILRMARATAAGSCGADKRQTTARRRKKRRRSAAGGRTLRRPERNRSRSVKKKTKKPKKNSAISPVAFVELRSGNDRHERRRHENRDRQQ